MAGSVAQESASSLKKKYAVSLKKAPRPPGTFTQDKPSRFLVDLLWIALVLLAALVFAGGQLKNRRATFRFAITGSEDTLDFTNIDPERLVQYLNDHVDMVREAMDKGNWNIHFLSRIADPLPGFIARPSRATVILAGLTYFYFLYRFMVLHRQWRYNNLLVNAGLLLYFPLILCSPADTMVSVLLAANFLFPALAAVSVVLHRLLGDSAWKPLTIMLELTPKKGQVREESQEGDAQALLDDGIDKKACP